MWWTNIGFLNWWNAFIPKHINSAQQGLNFVSFENKDIFSYKKIIPKKTTNSMIEQTAMVITKWHYTPHAIPVENEETIENITTLEVMKKRASTKKGIACRLSCRFTIKDITILEFQGEDSYVIDVEDAIDRAELLVMIGNSFTKFKEHFDFRKLGTLVQGSSVSPLNEKMMDLDPVLFLLQ